MIFKTLTAPKLTTLRNKGHISEVFGSFLNPDILWSARINEPGIVRGQTNFDFDTGSGSNFGAIEADMPVYVGTGPGQKDIGILRVRSISSGSGGVDGTLVVARNTLVLSDNLYLSFPNDHPLFPKYPLIIGDPDNADFRKDGDIAYSDQNNNLYPVVIAGPHRAGFINTTLGYYEVVSLLPDSYAMTPGATITSYTASAVPSTGVTIAIVGGTGVGTIRFANPGQYWVKYGVTDSNGRTQYSYRCYIVHEDDPTGSNYPTTAFDLTSITGDFEKGGWTLDLNFHDEATLNEIPDQTLAIVWARNYFNGVEENVTIASDDTFNAIITGYVRRDSIDKDLNLGTSPTTLTIETIETVLTNHYMFSVSLEAKNSTPTAWYEFRQELTVPRAVHHLWKWHSNIFEMTDIVGLNDNTDLRAFAELEDGNLYSMAQSILRDSGIRYHIISDKYGRLLVTPIIQLLTDAERAALSVIQNIQDADESQVYTVLRQDPNRAAFTKVSGFYWDGSYITTSTQLCPNPPCPDVEPLCSSAPTDMPDDDGPTVAIFDGQTLRSQAHCNELAGRYFAQINNLYPEIRLSFHGNYLATFDFYKAFWQTSIQAGDTNRGFTWLNKNLILKSVTATFNTSVTGAKNGVITTSAVFEPEMDGYPGVAGYCMDELPEEGGEETPYIDPGAEFGQALITGSSTWFRRLTEPTWELRSNEDVRDLIQDPYWRAKQVSFDPDDSIIIRCGIGYIKYSLDGGQNWSIATPSIDPPNNYSDSPAPLASSVTYEWIEPSYVTPDRFVFAVRWLNASGKWRTWLLKTDDFFNTFTWLGIGSGGGGSALTINLLNAETFAQVNTTTYQLGAGLYIQKDNSNPNLNLILYDTPTQNFSLLSSAVKNGTQGTGVFASNLFTTWNANATDVNFHRYTVTGGTTLNYTGVNTFAHGITGIFNFNAAFFVPTSATEGIMFYPRNVSASSTELTAFRIEETGGIINRAAPNSIVSTAKYIYIGATNTIGGVLLLYYYFNGADFEVRASLVDPVSLVITHNVTIATGFQLVANPLYDIKLRTIEIQPGRVMAIYSAKLPADTWKLYGCVLDVGAPLVAGTPSILLDTLNTTDLNSPASCVAAENLINGIATYPGGGGGGGTVIKFEIDPALLTIVSQTSTGPGIQDQLSTYTGLNGTGLRELYFDTNEYIVGINLAIGSTPYTNWLGAFTTVGGSFVTDQDAYPSGIATDKTSDDFFWFMYVLDNEYWLSQRSWVDLTEINGYLLSSSANIAAVQNEIDFAYPATPFDSQDTVYVFGRLNFELYSLGQINVARSVNQAIGFTVVENGWGNKCKALIADVNNVIYAIRGDSPSQLYAGSTSLTYYSDLPANVDNIRPHGFKPGYFGDLYVANGNGASVMVIRTIPPFTAWGDLTSNHGTGNGVEAIEVL